MTDDTTTDASATAQIAKLLQSADEDTQDVIRQTLAIEQAKLHQASRNRSAMARDIANEIRRVIK